MRVKLVFLQLLLASVASAQWGEYCQDDAFYYTEVHQMVRQSANDIQITFYGEKGGPFAHYFQAGIWQHTIFPNGTFDSVTYSDPRTENPEYANGGHPEFFYGNQPFAFTRSHRPTQKGFGVYELDLQVYFDAWACVEQPDPTARYTVNDHRTIEVKEPKLELTPTPPSYIPMNNAPVGGGTISGCPNSGGTVPSSPNPTYTASLFADDGALWHAKIRFKLSNISGTTASTVRNRGHSTNGCFTPACTAGGDDDQRDFDFVSADQTQAIYAAPTYPDATSAEIETNSQVGAATVVVSSRDYGGVARLSAQALFDDEHRATAKITGGSGAEFTAIPIDDNGNLIADAWENANGGPMAENADPEPGAPGSDTLHQGDGYFPHDEYRGFIIKSGSGFCHVRTDPRNKQDVFVFDESGLFFGDFGLLKDQTRGSSGARFLRTWSS